MEFDWDEGNEPHLEEHGIKRYQAEEAFDDPDRIGIDAHTGRRKLVGMTEEGRLITLIHEKRGKKIRVCTGWDSSEYERRAYNRKKGR